MVAEDKGLRVGALHTYRRLNCLQWLRLVERLLQVQMVATVAVVARKRETYTCTVGQIVAVVARRETSTRIAAVVAINQDPVYTGKYCLHGSGQILSPCTTRLRGTVTVLLIQVRTNFCQSQLWNGFLIKDAELGSTL